MKERILGPSGGGRKRALLASLSVAALLGLFFAITSSAGPVGIASGFEDDDGNLADNPPLVTADPPGAIDWNNFDPVSWQPSPSTTPTREAQKLAFGWQFKGIEDWQVSTSDTAFGGGTKQDALCPDVITAKAPNKDDLKRIYLASKTGSNGHTYLNLAWVRVDQNAPAPSAHVAFEFNKGETSCNEPGGLVQRAAGDMLIVYDFGGGDEAPTISLERWITTSGTCEIGSHSPPCWGEAVDLTDLGFAEGAVNTTTSVTDALTPPGLSSTTGTSVDETLGTKEFGEAGIDLTDAGVFQPGTCETFGTASGVSRTSGSDDADNAQMKDLVGPADFSLTNCGRIIIKKRTNPRGVDQNFSFTSNIAGSELTCTTDTTPASFTLNDKDGATGDSSNNTEDCTNVPAGSYTVTEGADPSGFTFAGLSCTASTGSSGSQDGTIPKQANITLVGGGTVTCIYTNNQNLGAILVTKTRKHAASGPGNHAHAGVSFTVNGVTKQTDANGQACFDGLTFGSYTVHETVPAGYNVDANDKSVTVDNNAKCSDNPYVGETVSFHNTPLTNITVSVNSQVDGGTGSTIDCDAAADPPFDHTVPATAPDNGDGSFTLSNKEPGTYTCTVIVDP